MPTVLLILLSLACRPSVSSLPGDSESGEPESGGADSSPVEPVDSAVDPPDGPRCDPIVRTDVVNWLEGDTVAFSFDCGSGEERGAFVATVSGRAPVTFDPSTWDVTWETGLADGGRYDLVLAVVPAELDPAAPEVFPETVVATFWVADDRDARDNVPVDPATYTEEWGLPVIHVQTDGSIPQTYVPATVTFDGHAYAAEVKVRGAASAGYPKPSYLLNFGDENLDVGAFGMGRVDHLVLITPFDDNAYVRQKLIYDLWIAMAAYWGEPRMTPRTFFAVVYLDGAYWGLYTACDHIDEDFAADMGMVETVNVYKAVNHDANFYSWTSSGRSKSSWHTGYEKKEGVPEDGQPGAWADLDALVEFAATTEDDPFVEEAPTWILPHEYMDWLYLVHWTASDDSGAKNSYIVNDPASWLFRYVPWDFNHSYGQGWYTYRISADTYNDFKSTNGIFAHYENHPTASVELWDRFRALMTDGPLTADWMVAQVDAYFALIGRSASRDWDTWGDTYLSYWAGSNDNDYVRERAYLYDWIRERETWMWAYHP